MTLAKAAYAAFLLSLIAFLLQPAPVRAEQYLVYQYSDQVRIVLSKNKCKDKGYKAAAQRIDGEYMPACYSVEKQKGIVHIQWAGGDFSEFPLNYFKLAEQ